ncbi:LysR family transcriptional regulator [Actinomadura rubrobrunea]|uniref:LysR family transcriptional regulator n=1 Tax=Actinomadura rubrobrunea TaxID=115335 RepID=A0A9W6PQU9_9ACTN|nr:LysR family transcriptional regulator [Actinomadura rubrobrunea]GLW61785.1 LysR family transcriptional regulator [Actinomadura rubrobrunea]
MLDLGRLRVLRELKLRGTVSAVASALGYTPSAVSQQLAQLQREVGVPLVERAGRRLRLTEAGEVLAEHAETLLAKAQRAEEETLAASGRVAGTVRAVAYQTALLHVVAPTLPRLAAEHPDLVVEVLDEEFVRVLQALVLREIDLVLTDEYTHLPRPRRPELAAEVLISERMRIALPAAHPLAARPGPVRMAELAEQVWATGHHGTNHADLLERTCVELGGFRPLVRYRSNDLMVVFALVAQGCAAALVPDLSLAEDQEDVVVRDIADAPVSRRMVMWTRVGADVRPSVRAVLEALRHSADLLVARRPGLVRGVPDAGAESEARRRPDA